MRSASLSLALLLSFSLDSATAHMSPFLGSMYGVGKNWDYPAGDPVSPIGPGVGSRDAWWFRGPAARALPPTGRNNSLALLPAGGSFEVDITCHVAWSGVGWRTTPYDSPLDACPENPGAYHADGPLGPSDPNIDRSLVSGCALAIADVDDIGKTNMENLVIFSVLADCVRTKKNVFQVPAAMPKCTGSKCICSWFWLTERGQANFYMTAFDCSVINSPPGATRIAPPSDPKFCLPGNSTCQPQVGAKRPLYAYNTPTNVVWQGNENRPGYHASWSFFDGAQNDIFLAPGGGNASASGILPTVTIPVSIPAVTTTSIVLTPIVTIASSQIPTLSTMAPAVTSTIAPVVSSVVSIISAVVPAIPLIPGLLPAAGNTTQPAPTPAPAVAPTTTQAPIVVAPKTTSSPLPVQQTRKSRPRIFFLNPKGVIAPMPSTP